MKKIIGYKLIKPEYKEAVNKICNTISFDFKRLEANAYSMCFGLQNLKNAGVLDLWFEPVYEKEYKIGDWVYVIDGGYGSRGANDFIGQITNKESALKLKYNGEYRDFNAEFYVTNFLNSWGLCKGCKIRKLDEEEIETYLIKKAKERGFKDRINFNAVRNTFLSDTSTGFQYKKNNAVVGSSFEYKQETDTLYTIGRGRYIVYERGIWAEIVPQIKINGYRIEFFDTHVEFGYNKIHKNVFIGLNLLNMDLRNGDCVIGMESNREIESVTIGKGIFSKEQIKEIAEYYLNKKIKW